MSMSPSSEPGCPALGASESLSGWRSGAILPFGGPVAYKGYCLSMIVEILGGALSGQGCANGEILLPGDPEYRTGRQRQEEGIPIDDTTWSHIVEAAHSLGLDPQAWSQ